MGNTTIRKTSEIYTELGTLPFISLSHPEGRTLLSDPANVPTERGPGPAEPRPWASAVAGVQQGWRGAVEGGGCCTDSKREHIAAS